MRGSIARHINLLAALEFDANSKQGSLHGRSLRWFKNRFKRDWKRFPHYIKHVFHNAMREHSKNVKEQMRSMALTSPLGEKTIVVEEKQNG